MSNCHAKLGKYVVSGKVAYCSGGLSKGDNLVAKSLTSEVFDFKHLSIDMLKNQRTKNKRKDGEVDGITEIMFLQPIHSCL